MTVEAVRRRRRQSYFPPQHGAWAFIGLPVLTGLVVSPWTPLLLAVAIAGFAAFPLSHFVTAILRYPHKERYVRPLAFWAVLTAVPVAIAVWFRPWLVVAGIAYMVVFGINLLFARSRRERDLANDLVFIVECVALVPVMWGIGASSQAFGLPDWSAATSQLWTATALCALAMIGSTLHVKSLIRERDNPAYHAASVVWSVLCLPVVFLLGGAGIAGLVLTIPFLYFLARAVALRGRSLKPGVIGVVELGGFVLVFGAILLAG